MEDGNTISSSRTPLSKIWSFTLNNPTEDHLDHLDQEFRQHGAKWIFQLEIGDGGTPHFQGHVEFKLRKRLSTVRAHIGGGAHCEITRHPKASIEYCRKPSDLSGLPDAFRALQARGPIWQRGIPKPIRSVVRRDNLRTWQRGLFHILQEEADDRTVRWYWDERGGSGKTAFARFLVLEPGINAIYVGGKSGDVKYAISQLKDLDDLIVLWNIPRSLEKFVSYQGIEEVKDGVFFSSKYESGMICFNPPHVVIFANFEPDRDMLSNDRWSINHIAMI